MLNPKLTPEQVIQSLPRQIDSVLHLMTCYSKTQHGSYEYQVLTEHILKKIRVYQRALLPMIVVYRQFARDPDQLGIQPSPLFLGAYLTRFTFLVNSLTLMGLIGGDEIHPDQVKEVVRVYRGVFEQLKQEKPADLFQNNQIMIGYYVKTTWDRVVLDTMLSEHHMHERTIQDIYLNENLLDRSDVDRLIMDCHTSILWVDKNIPYHTLRMSSRSKRLIALHATLGTMRIDRKALTHILANRFAAWYAYGCIKKHAGKLPIITYPTWVQMADEHTENITLH